MPKYEILRAASHAHLRIARADKVDLIVDSTMVLPKEIWLVHREFPIFFRKHADTGRFFPNALFGFQKGENYFVNEQHQWLGDYCPLSLRKGPFMIAVQPGSSGENLQRLVAIDVEDPRVLRSGDSGELLFEYSGALTEYTASITDVLYSLHEGAAQITQMMDMYTELDLIEPVNVKISLEEGKSVELIGAYTINEEVLTSLEANKLAALNQAGFLAPAFYIVASVSNIQRLIDRRNLLRPKI